MGSIVFGGEREVWYDAEGRAVRVIEDGEPVKESFKPQWEQREVKEAPRDGVIQWDSRTRFGSGGYSRVYPIYPDSFYDYRSPRKGWHGGYRHGWRGSRSSHSWAGWGWSGVRIRVGN